MSCPQDVCPPQSPWGGRSIKRRGRACMSGVDGWSHREPVFLGKRVFVRRVITTQHLGVQCLMTYLSPGTDFNLPPAPAMHSLTTLSMPEDSRRLSPGPCLQTTGPLMGNEFLSFSDRPEGVKSEGPSGS